MKERTRKFLEQFTKLNNEDFRVSFGDIFTEFIDILNNLDLSDKTLLYINEIFNKDMHLFFKDMEIKKKKFVSKQKVKDVIEKYFMEYEEEKQYRYTPEVEEEQEILIKIENEIIDNSDE